MPRPRWKPAEELTPFARLVRDEYMWGQTPPLSVPQLSDQTGISKQTIWGWINHGSTPRRDTVLQLARTTGLPLNDLLQAAGLPTDVEKATARRQNRKIAEEILSYLRGELSAKFSPEEMQAIDAYLTDGLRGYLNGEEPAQSLHRLQSERESDQGQEPRQPERAHR